ncbi:hypothetical protein ACFL96_03455 [Thermoproteota archaeon]
MKYKVISGLFACNSLLSDLLSNYDRPTIEFAWAYMGLTSKIVVLLTDPKIKELLETRSDEHLKLFSDSNFSRSMSKEKKERKSQDVCLEISVAEELVILHEDLNWKHRSYIIQLQKGNFQNITPDRSSSVSIIQQKRGFRVYSLLFEPGSQFFESRADMEEWLEGWRNEYVSRCGVERHLKMQLFSYSK